MTRRDVLPAGWDYGPERRPARSMLVPPEPLGLGTGAVEALTSWIPRLAARHHLPASYLARFVLAPALGRGADRDEEDEWGRYFAAIFGETRGSLNGLDRYAASWVEALEVTSGATDLAALTMLPYAAAFGPRGLNAPHRRVCGSCLSEDVAAGRPMYERLAWFVAPVSRCHRHGTSLADRCETCGRRNGCLGTWSMPGRCRCGAGLTVATPAAGGDHMEWEAFVAAEVDALLATGVMGAHVWPPGYQGRVLGLAVSRLGGTRSALARATGYSLSQVSLWCDERRRPSLEGALRVCRVTGFHLADYVSGDLEALVATRGTPGDVPPPMEWQRLIPWPGVIEGLEATLSESIPRPLYAICRSLDVSPQQVRERVPDLATRIRERHARWRDEMRSNRHAQESSIVMEVAEGLAALGLEPGRERVEQALPGGLSMRTAHVRTAWRAARSRLTVTSRVDAVAPMPTVPSGSGTGTSSGVRSGGRS